MFAFHHLGWNSGKWFCIWCSSLLQFSIERCHLDWYEWLPSSEPSSQWWQEHAILHYCRWCLDSLDLDDEDGRCNLSVPQRIFNYRLSRARHICGNCAWLTCSICFSSFIWFLRSLLCVAHNNTLEGLLRVLHSRLLAADLEVEGGGVLTDKFQIGWWSTFPYLCFLPFYHVIFLFMSEDQSFQLLLLFL